jgi:hypothetical protein
MLWSQRYRSCGRELRKTRRHSADCGCKSLKTSLYFSRLCEFHQITASCTILVNNAISASPPCNLTCQEKPGVAYSAGKSDTPCLGIAGVLFAIGIGDYDDFPCFFVSRQRSTVVASACRARHLLLSIGYRNFQLAGHWIKDGIIRGPRQGAGFLMVVQVEIPSKLARDGRLS